MKYGGRSAGRSECVALVVEAQGRNRGQHDREGQAYPQEGGGGVDPAHVVEHVRHQRESIECHRVAGGGDALPGSRCGPLLLRRIDHLPGTCDDLVDGDEIGRVGSG